MNPKIFVFTLGLSMFLLVGCPINTAFPLGKKGETAFNESLLGIWTNDHTDGVATKVSITKDTDLNCAVLHIDTKGEMFMAETVDFKIWLTTIEQKTFLVLQDLIDGVPHENYHAYHLLIDERLVITSDISLLVDGSDAITSIDNYRAEVKASMSESEFLADPIEWKKN